MSAARGAHLDEVFPTLPFAPLKGEGAWLEDADGRNAWLNTASSIFELMYRWPADTPADDEAEDPEPAKAGTKKRKGGK